MRGKSLVIMGLVSLVVVVAYDQYTKRKSS